jgi:1-phosphofructokinase
MVAGVVSAKLRGLALAETARLATAFSVRAIGNLGPDASIESLSQKVTIQK